MECTITRLPYRQTGAFSKIAADYIDQAEPLKPFFSFAPTLQGIKKAIEERKNFAVNRKVLVEELQKQYAAVTTSDRVKSNIELLLSDNTFTVTTAHQNNIFTGPLYFIYKILHVIRLAEQLTASLPENNFVPVFYIGSEDADLDELSHIWLGGEKLTWNTKQTGAVGRMKIDKDFVKLIEAIEGQVVVYPSGKEIVSLLREHYKEGATIQDATFSFVNTLFAVYGLVVLLPDNAVLKKQTVEIFKDDLLHQAASGIVNQTAARLTTAGYKVQANPREINLFYLKNNKRERIEKENDIWKVVNGEERFTEKEILLELEEHPERFSPNVILRGLYQETLLPNIAFIGGGGETAYWLQLKGLFDFYKVPFPVLVLRNSFLVVEKKWQQAIGKLGFTIEDFFLPLQEVVNKLVAKESNNKLKLNGTFSETEQLYSSIKKQVSAIDITLEKHVEALKTEALHRLQELEKKMLRAEKRKFTDQQRQIQTIKNQLFPGNGLQERHENIAYYYSKWGKDFIEQLYRHSLGLEQEFVVIIEK